MGIVLEAENDSEEAENRLEDARNEGENEDRDQGGKNTSYRPIEYHNIHFSNFLYISFSPFFRHFRPTLSINKFFSDPNKQPKLNPNHVTM